jgi:hypothetical protein
MALRPTPGETNGHLDPVAASFLASWQQFGEPVAVMGLGGIVDRRAELYVPREAWLDREIRPAGLDPEAWRRVWAALDLDALQRAAEAMTKGSDA